MNSSKLTNEKLLSPAAREKLPTHEWPPNPICSILQIFGIDTWKRGRGVGKERDRIGREEEGRKAVMSRNGLVM